MPKSSLVSGQECLPAITLSANSGACSRMVDASPTRPTRSSSWIAVSRLVCSNLEQVLAASIALSLRYMAAPLVRGEDERDGVDAVDFFKFRLNFCATTRFKGSPDEKTAMATRRSRIAGQRLCQPFGTSRRRKLGENPVTSAFFLLLSYLIPTAIESGPVKCSTRVSLNPASRIHCMQSLPV